MKTESIKKLNFIYLRSEDEIIKKTVQEILRIEENRASGKFDYYKYTCTEPLRMTLMGVYHDNGFKVASNLHILIAIKDEYNPELEGRILMKDGELLDEDAKYPNWKSVIPDLESRKFPKMCEVVKIDFDKWAELYKGYKVDKKLKIEKYIVKVGNAYYGVELFNLLVAALKKIGKDELTNIWNIDGVKRGLEIVEELRPAAGIAKSNDDSIVLLMPRRFEEGHDECYIL